MIRYICTTKLNNITFYRNFFLSTQRRPEDKYAVKERPRPQQDYKRPVESKPQQRAEVAALAPIQYRQTSPRPPPPVAKSYKTSACQSVGPQLKTTTTQTQVILYSLRCLFTDSRSKLNVYKTLF